MKIDGAIFDCDGTLVDSLGFWDMFYKRVGEDFSLGQNFRPSDSDDKTARTQPISFLSRMLHEGYGVGESAQAIADYIYNFFVWFYNEVVELKAGARELLSALADRGVRMCIATASEKSLIEIALKKHGVLEYFERIVDCTTVGAGKDKPDVFLYAERLLGTPHESTFVFEDSLLAMKTAKSAGFGVIGIYDKHTFGQDEARALCDAYVDNGDRLDKAIGFFA